MSDSPIVTYRALNRNSQPLDGTPCREFCLNGNRCVLDGKVAHKLHACAAPTCICHGQLARRGQEKLDALMETHTRTVSHREATPPTASAHPAAGDRHARETEGGTR